MNCQLVETETLATEQEHFISCSVAKLCGKLNLQDPGFTFLINPEGAHDCMHLTSLSTVTPPLQFGNKAISVLIHAQNLAS